MSEVCGRQGQACAAQATARRAVKTSINFDVGVGYQSRPDLLTSPNLKDSTSKLAFVTRDSICKERRT
jgi:hypothetical protein